MRSLILLCSMMVQLGCPTPVNPVTCKASATTVGEPANVTCTFNMFLDDPKTEIIVVHHPFEAATDDLGTNVLVCFWPKNAGKPNCIASDGYTFNGNISSVLTLEIPVVTQHHAGDYACHIIPPDGFIVQSCSLSLQDSVTIPPITKASLNGTSIAPYPETDGPQGTMTPVMIILGLVTVMVNFALIGIICRQKQLSKRICPLECMEHDEKTCTTADNDEQVISRLLTTLSEPEPVKNCSMNSGNIFDKNLSDIGLCTDKIWY